jgi:hypothetical protein
MKRTIRSIVLATIIAALAAAPVLAGAGGMPAAHGVDGRTFGGAVSGLAQSNPLGLAGHVSGR